MTKPVRRPSHSEKAPKGICPSATTAMKTTMGRLTAKSMLKGTPGAASACV